MGKETVKDPLKVADKMRTLCSRREYCRADVYRKVLEALDGDSGKAAEITETLISERYVDDYRYASAYARDKSSIAGWGSMKIRHMLSAKGIGREVIDEALSEVDEGRAATRLEKLMKNKAGSLSGDPQIRLKLTRFALGRGYEYDDVKKVIDSIMND